MAFDDLETARIKRLMMGFIERRGPPPHLWDQVKLDYRIAGHSVEIFEIRPSFSNPKQPSELPLAKTTFIRSKNLWRVFWMRRDLKWHAYQALPVAPNFEAFLGEVERDPTACFFG
jgi:hypothetical protein